MLLNLYIDLLSLITVALGQLSAKSIQVSFERVQHLLHLQYLLDFPTLYLHLQLSLLVACLPHRTNVILNLLLLLDFGYLWSDRLFRLPWRYRLFIVRGTLKPTMNLLYLLLKQRKTKKAEEIAEVGRYSFLFERRVIRIIQVFFKRLFVKYRIAYHVKQHSLFN